MDQGLTGSLNCDGMTAEQARAALRHLLKAAASLQQADAVTTPTDNGKPKTKRRQDVTQSEAAQLCSVTAKTVQRWDKGEGTPSGYPGRQDAVTLRAWAARREEAAKLKRGLTKMTSVRDMDQGLTVIGLPQDNEDACAMARDMIETCQSVSGPCEYNWANRDNQKASIRCNYFRDRTCPARAYLARHGNDDAWVCGATGGLSNGARGVAAGVSG